MKYWIFIFTIALSLPQDGDAIFGRRKEHPETQETYKWQYPHENVRPSSHSVEVDAAFSFLWSTISPAEIDSPHRKPHHRPLSSCFKCLCGGSESSEENSTTGKKPKGKKGKDQKKNKHKSGKRKRKPWGFGKSKNKQNEVDANSEFDIVCFKR